jgi:4-hydroxy-tetrahydrodipicolinate synthase
LLICPLWFVDAVADAASNPMPPAEFKEKLVGPIVVIGTPFKSDGGIDHDGVREMIRRGLANEARVFALTAGDSFYAQLSIDEVKDLTNTLVAAVGDDGITIAATGEWPKEDVLDYVKFAEAAGADAVQVLVPPKASDDEIVDFYRDVDEATQLGIVLHGKFSPELLTRIVEIDSVVAMKEDISLEYLTDRLLQFGDRLNIFPGGSEGRFLVAWPFGATAYYSGIYQFKPDLAKEFWHAMQNGDVRAAREFVRKYDDPFIKNFRHAFWRASKAHFGVSERYMRPLDKSYTDEQMAEVARFWDRLGVPVDADADAPAMAN